MNVKLSVLQELAPTQQRSLILGGVGVVLAIAIYFLGVDPWQQDLATLQESVTALSTQRDSVLKDIASSGKRKEKLEALTQEMDFYQERLLEPLLESYAMRARSYLDPLARKTGVVVESYSELPVIALPFPGGAPGRLYVRQSVAMPVRGSYAQIVAFIQAVEETHPLVALSGITITADGHTPLVQTAALVFEWPAAGEAYDFKKYRAKNAKK